VGSSTVEAYEKVYGPVSWTETEATYKFAGAGYATCEWKTRLPGIDIDFNVLPNSSTPFLVGNDVLGSSLLDLGNKKLYYVNKAEPKTDESEKVHTNFLHARGTLIELLDDAGGPVTTESKTFENTSPNTILKLPGRLHVFCECSAHSAEIRHSSGFKSGHSESDSPTLSPVAAALSIFHLSLLHKSKKPTAVPPQHLVCYRCNFTSLPLRMLKPTALTCHEHPVFCLEGNIHRFACRSITPSNM